MNLSEIAYRAADLISEKGHCKGELEDAEGRLCLFGALWTAATGRSCGNTGGWARDAVISIGKCITALLAADGTVLPPLMEAPLWWNDNLVTTREDVVLMLKKAGKEMEDESR